MEQPAFTLGVEEEFQIIDPDTRELRSHVQEILDEGKLVLKERVKPEMHQSVIEIGTGICKNIAEVRQDVGEMRAEIIRLARKNGMRVASAGTHPFSNWADQKIFPDPRYDSVVQEMQQLARANLIFGLHVHVGIKDRALAIQIMNEALYFLPHMLALSTNSPFWLGRNTGLKSFRTKVFDRFPRTGMPEYFESPAEFDEFVAHPRRDQLHRQRQEDLVGRPPAPVLRDDRVPRLRRARCGSTRRSRSRRSSRRSASSSTAFACRTWAGGGTAARSSSRTSGAPAATASTAR